MSKGNGTRPDNVEAATPSAAYGNFGQRTVERLTRRSLAF